MTEGDVLINDVPCNNPFALSKNTFFSFLSSSELTSKISHFLTGQNIKDSQSVMPVVWYGSTVCEKYQRCKIFFDNLNWENKHKWNTKINIMFFRTTYLI